MIDAMLEAARIYKEPRYLASAEKGGEFILLAQMPEPQPGWAQQYDRDMHPAWARRFEPPSITGGESQSVMRALMLLYRETGKRKYLEPLPRALAYYRRSVLPDVEQSFRDPSAGVPQSDAVPGAFLRAEDEPAAVHHEGNPGHRSRSGGDERRRVRGELQRCIGDHSLRGAGLRTRRWRKSNGSTREFRRPIRLL